MLVASEMVEAGRRRGGNDVSQAGIAHRAVFEGRYEMLHPLRAGGFAEVYKARQLATGQMVAVKVMHPVPSGNPATAARRADRFQREMRLCARLHHPNVVRLIDSGQTDEGLLFTVFEFVPGQNLADLIAGEGALVPREARYLMLQVLDALACAHEQSVVHRDLKPANIMVVPTGARRNALVLDFGIGALTAPDVDGARITGSNEIVCTPTYAAPEQLAGLAPTARSDLYAWGLVFLECLTGRPSITGASLQEMLQKQIGPEPIAIPAALRDHPLGDILRRATVKDVEARPVTARGLLRELEATDVGGVRREGLGGADPPAESRPKREASPETRPIDPRPPPSGPVADPGQLLEGERRPLTVVCCALTAAGPNLEAADVEEIDEVLGEEQSALAEIATRHRGRVAGTVGERVLVLFGHPVAEEDDPRRAAETAIEIVAHVAERSARLLTQRGIGLEIRIAVHTGLVVAREESDRLKPQGTTAQIASGLCVLAEPGAILVSGEAHRLLRERFTFTPESPRRITGIVRPVEVHRLGGVRSLTDTSPSNAARASRRIVGRDRELDLLLQRWSQAEQGTGQCVLLTGGPGIGKSRLARELLRRLPAGTFILLECRCEEDRQGTALYPVIEMIDRLLDPGRDDASRDRLARLEAWLTQYGFNPDEAVPLLAALLSISIEGRYPPPAGSLRRRTERTFDVLLALLCEMAEDKPILILVEKLHRADPATLEWLGALVEGVPSARILTLLTARPEFAPPWSTSGMLQIQLGRLDRPDVERMIAHLTGGRALPPPLLEGVLDRADGVPLFVEELTRMVLESGLVAEESGRLVLTGATVEPTIPTTLRGLFMTRLDRLGRAKETAQIAAAIGREFRHDVLSAVCAHDEAEVREDLDRLVAADLVHRRRRVRYETYVFKHALIRDAAYESLPRRTRIRVHLRIARTLEDCFPEVARKQPFVLALQFAAAEQKQQAIMFAERAAELALKGPAGSAGDIEAVAHVQRALGWASSIDDERERASAELRLNNLLILALLDRRGYMAPELAVAVRRSRELCDALGEGPLTAPTLFAMFEYHHMRGQRAEACALATRLVSIADRTGDTGLSVWASPLLGHCLWKEGRLAEARARLARALELYDPAVHREHASFYGLDSRMYAQSALAIVLAMSGELAGARAEIRAAVAWAREIDHPNSLGGALLYECLVHHHTGERERVVEAARELVQLTTQRKLWFKEYGLILQAWLEKDLDSLVPRLDALRASGQRLALTYYLSLAAEVEADLGQHEAAVRRLDTCLELAAETGEIYYLADIYRLRAASILARDAAAPDGESCLRRAVAIAGEQGARTTLLRAALALSRLLMEQGRREEARAILRDAGAPDRRAQLPDVADEVNAILDSKGRLIG
ncbi:MAG: TOMM system kinase/cyclase fusion protein [Minicystis sp.]